MRRSRNHPWPTLNRQINYLWACLLAVACLAGCTKAIGTTPTAFETPIDVSLAASNHQTDKVSLALFIGMDDYNGNQLPGIKEVHKLLASVGSNKQLDIFLAADSDEKNDGFRTRVTTNQSWGTGFEPLGELQTNRTPDLRNYLAWVGNQGHAGTTHLVINTHGGAYAGILWDYDGNATSTYPATGLTLKRTYKALAKGFEGGRIDSLTFDACMMASIEVGEALKGTVAVMNGSEDFSMGGSLPWDIVAGTLAAGNNLDGAAFSRYVTESIIKRGRWGENGSRTWSAIKLDIRFDQLVKSVDKLASALLSAMKSEPVQIRQAAAETQMFAIMKKYAEHYGDFYQRDIIDFCQSLRRNVRDPIVHRVAADVEAAVQEVVIAFANHPSETMAHGLAIYLPHGINHDHVAARLKVYQDSVFAQHTRWDEFLLALNS